MTHPFAPEQLALLVARFVTDGLPAPLAISFTTNHVQVTPADLEVWLKETAAEGEWRTTKQGGDVFTAQAVGFKLTAWRPHQCDPTP